ncbi:MAG: hypothetical protein L3J39_12095 [Verrucomicrobiales bacterium]|nr:hypothetical protein [Verrucomicrobiales bacterium]
MSSTTPAPTALIKSAALLSLLVILLAATGLFALSSTNRQHHDSLKRLEQFHAAELAATETRAHFKTQVQEWKNLLLRGADPTSFEKYQTQFQQQNQQVQKKLVELQRLLQDLGEENSSIQELIIQHQKLQQTYTEALTHYSPQSPSSAFKVDAAVRGADRPLSKQIEQLAEDIYQLSKKYHQLAQQQAATRYETLRKVTTVVASLTVLCSFLLVFFANRRPRS